MSILPPAQQTIWKELSHLQNLHFVLYGGTGRINDPINTEDATLQLASLDDLMAHKLKVILQRSEAKDYQDISAMIQAKVSLEKGLSAAMALFGPSFQPSESLKACTYFQDGDLHTLERSIKSTLIEACAKVKELPIVMISSSYLSLRKT